MAPNCVHRAHDRSQVDERVLAGVVSGFHGPRGCSKQRIFVWSVKSDRNAGPGAAGFDGKIKFRETFFGFNVDDF
ncbi:TPA: hypothetical protein DF272_05110 [Candidatus Falkowbacteria bacterium]|nr:hypothetical protein [Candidatus Falkowbacteria bacterium]